MFVVCIDRMNATSSTTPAKCGIAFDTHAPHFPCFANLKGLRITELLEDVLLTQPGMSRLIARLEERGLVARADDPDDRRACRVRLTRAGERAQREIGLAHGRHVAEAMTRILSREQLVQLRDLCRGLIA